MLRACVQVTLEQIFSCMIVSFLCPIDLDLTGIDPRVTFSYIALQKAIFIKVVCILQIVFQIDVDLSIIPLDLI